MVVVFSCLKRQDGSHQSGEESLSKVGEGGRARCSQAADAPATATGTPTEDTAATMDGAPEPWLCAEPGAVAGAAGATGSGLTGASAARCWAARIRSPRIWGTVMEPAASTCVTRVSGATTDGVATGSGLFAAAASTTTGG